MLWAPDREKRHWSGPIEGAQQHGYSRVLRRMVGEKTEAGGEPPTLAIAERALEFVRDDQVVGLGSGPAATAFIQALGRRVEEGLRIRGFPTSEATADLAKRLGIPLIRPGGDRIDLTVDGAVNEAQLVSCSEIYRASLATGPSIVSPPRLRRS